jgi:hypothetical protein
MNQRERAQRLVALLTQSFEMGWDGHGADDRINVFAGDVVASVALPDVEGKTENEARILTAAAGFAEGLKFVRTLVDLIAVMGLGIEEMYPEVDFREVIQCLGIYAASLPDDKD